MEIKMGPFIVVSFDGKQYYQAYPNQFSNIIDARASCNHDPYLSTMHASTLPAINELFAEYPSLISEEDLVRVRPSIEDTPF